MTDHVIYPEVPGVLGDRTTADSSVNPMVVHHVHFEFDNWLGDDLVSSFPVYLASPRLVDAIARAGLTGTTTEHAELTLAPDYLGTPDARALDFVWLKVHGQVGVDDIALDQRARFVVNDRALAVLRAEARLDLADIEPVTG